MRNFTQQQCISTQKQPNCKKRCGPCKKDSMKKVVKSKVAAQKWLWWSDNCINNNISGKFVLPPPTGNRHQNSPEMLLKFLPLSDHHSHFWAATFDLTTFFMLPLLHGPHLFLQFGCFCVDFISFCNLTLQATAKPDKLTLVQ